MTDDLIERLEKLVQTGKQYAASELNGAPTSTFEIYMGHFEAISAEIASALRASAGREMGGKPQRVTYTNWRGETSEREIRPLYLWYGSTEWHPEPQWLITARDCGKGVERDFALSGFTDAPTQGGSE